MNHQVKSPFAGKCWAGLFFALLFPQLVVGESIASPILGAVGARPSHARRISSSYLVAVGPPALRFEESAAEIALRPDISTHPAALPPPLPTSGQSAGQNSILDVLLAPGWSPPVMGAPKPAPKTRSESAVPPDSPPILSDDSVRVRPEDFLPFFQFPGSEGDGQANASDSEPAARKNSYGSPQ
jgi:hypothetical protein